MSITRTSSGASISGGGAPSTHASSHQSGGSDEINVSNLSGALADAQTPAVHSLGGSEHSADTLANLNAKISDATLDGSGSTRPPTTHGADHVSTGSDAIPDAVAAGASGLLSGSDKTKLDGIEALADVTDATNVEAAGSVMTSGVSTVDATVLTTETSTTYVPIAGMSTTPGAGSYLAWFSAMILGDADDEQMVFGIHVNGVLVASSERDLPKGTNKDKNDTALSIHCAVTAGAGEAVDVRWKQPSGVQTMQTTSRTLTVIRV